MFINFLTENHTYSFAATGIDIKDRTFSTREDANQLMYKIMAKHHLTLKEVFNDHHDKTYVCDKGVCFYIQREK